MMKLYRSLFILSLTSIVLLVPGVSLAAPEPCPSGTINGKTWSSEPNSLGSKCVYPRSYTETESNFGAGSYNQIQAALAAFNTKYNNVSQNGIQDGGGQGPTNIDDHIPNQNALQYITGTTPRKTSECSSWTITGWTTASCWLRSVYQILYYVAYALYSFAGICLNYAAWYLDGAIFYLVLYMGAFVNSPDALGVRDGWAAIRDICNILIIGGFVAVGISTILQIAQYSADKFLARLIIAALLVNFSYFFAGAIIDATNYVAAITWHSKFINNDCVSKMNIEAPEGGGLMSDIGGALGVTDQPPCAPGRSLANTLNIASFDTIARIACETTGGTNCAGATTGGNIDFINTGSRTVTNQSDVYWQLFVLCLFGAMFLGVFAIILAVMAFYLVGRFAILILLLVASPIGVAGINIPFVDTYAQRWWSMLISQALFAPVFFILLGVSLKVINGLTKFLDSYGRDFGTAMGGAGPGIIGGNLALFMTYFVAMALLGFSFYAARGLAQSAQEFKGIYDMLGKRGFQTAILPMTLGRQGLGLGLGAARFGTENLAAFFGSKSAVGRVLTGTSAMLRTSGRWALGQKKGDKSSWEEAQENIGNKRKTRLTDQDYVMGGFWSQPWWSLRGRGPGSKPKNQRTPAEQAQVDFAQKGRKGEDILDEEGPEGVMRMLKNGDLTEEQQKAIFASPTLNDKQRKNLANNGVFESFWKKFNAQDHDGARNELADMTEYQRKLLLTENRELLQNKEFLALLKHEEFEKLMKDRDIVKSDSEAAKVGELRKSGHETLLVKMDNPDHAKRLLGSMSEREKNGLKLDVFTHKNVIKNLSVDEVRSRYRAKPQERAAIVEKAIEHHEQFKGMTAEDVHAILSEKQSPAAIVKPPPKPEEPKPPTDPKDAEAVPK